MVAGLASAIVWVVVTSYSLTSALGHAALNRLDTAGQRTATADSYKDHRADLARAQEQLSWIPKHRPAQAVQADIDSLKDERRGPTRAVQQGHRQKGRELCQKYHALSAELASAQQSIALEARVADIQGKMTHVTGAAVMTEADPQAAVLAKLARSLPRTSRSRTCRWRSRSSLHCCSRSVRASACTSLLVSGASTRATRRPHHDGAGQHRCGSGGGPCGRCDSKAAFRRERQQVCSAGPETLVPENDVERFYKERIETQDGSSLTATSLYEDYCAWCEDQQKEPLALPTFGREFGELGVQKARIAGGVRYVGIALKSAGELEEDKKLTAPSERPPRS